LGGGGRVALAASESGGRATASPTSWLRLPAGYVDFMQLSNPHVPGDPEAMKMAYPEKQFRGELTCPKDT